LIFALSARFRICIGCVVVYFLITHLEVFGLFHSAEKAIPSAVLQTYYRGDWHWSLNWLHDSSAYQYTLIALGFAAGDCLILGWQCRIATIACWI